MNVQAEIAVSDPRVVSGLALGGLTRLTRTGAPGVAPALCGASVRVSTDLGDRIDRARRSFVARARARIDRAAELTSGFGPDAVAPSDPALAELQALAHSLCGTAGSFGFNRLSEIAGMLEDAILSTQPRFVDIFRLVVKMGIEFLARVSEPKSAATN